MAGGHHLEPTATRHDSLKLGSTVKSLATKVRYTASGTVPGSGGPSGSCTARARVVS